MTTEDIESLERLLRLAELDTHLRQASLEEVLPKPTSLEEALAVAKKGGAVRLSGKIDGRIAAGKRRAKKNAQRRNKAARQKRWKKKWKIDSLEQAVNGSYYEYFSRRWKHRGRKWLITEEEWDTHIQPTIPEGELIALERLDTSVPTTLSNLIVYNSNREVLFDGNEYKMKSLGYIL
jgi:hypothetical protein